MPVSLGETTMTRDVRLDDRAIAHALPVTSNATQSRASRLGANSSSASGRVWMRSLGAVQAGRCARTSGVPAGGHRPADVLAGIREA
jgi:hypothetical protein